MSLDVRVTRRQLPQVAVTRQNQRMHWRGMLLGPIPENWLADKPETAKKIPGTGGVMVLAVNKDSPMLKEGVTSGSIIVSIAGRPVGAISELQAVINETPSEKFSVQLADGPTNVVASVPVAGN
jgi:S1-C subfamily serine protease